MLCAETAEEEDTALGLFMASQMLRLHAATAEAVPFPGLSMTDSEFLQCAMPFVRKALEKRPKLQPSRPTASPPSKCILPCQRVDGPLRPAPELQHFAMPFIHKTEEKRPSLWFSHPTASLPS